MQRLDEHTVTRRNFLKGAALAAAGGVLAACAPAAAPATGTAPAADEGADDMPMRKGGTLVFGYPQKTSYQNLLAMEHNAGNRRYYLIGLTHNCLVNISPDYTTWLPELAESWEFDGNRAIFNLRKDVKWHDGEPFTSADVLFTIGRLTGHPNVLRWNGVRNLKDMVVGLEEFSLGEADEVSGVSAPDDYTFVFELKKPFRAAFLERLLSHPIMPKHLLGAIPEEQWAVDEQGQQGLKSTEYALKQGTGTGPYRVTNFIPDQIVEYEPFDDYFGGTPQLDKLVFVPYTDHLAMAAALEKGECHIGIRTPQSEFERFKAMDHLHVVLNHGPSAVVFYWQFRYELADMRVRQGLSLALDRERIAKDFFFDTVPPLYAPVQYADYGISPDCAKWYEYNPDLARQLLEEGGWDFDYKLRYAVQSISPTWEPLLAMCSEMFADVGVQTEYQILGAEFSNVVSNPPYDYDTQFSGYGWGVTPGSFIPALSYERFGPDTTEGIEMINEILVMEDEEEIKQAVLRLQEFLAEFQRHGVISQLPGIHIVNNAVKSGNVVPVYGPRTDWIDWVNVYVES